MIRPFAAISLWTALAAAPLVAITIPAGTEVHVRLTSKVASSESKEKQAVRAAVIAPVLVNGQIAVPAGAELIGTIKEVQSPADPKSRATLLLDFSELQAAGVRSKLQARVAEIENARESVDENGRILGIIPHETLTSRIDQGIGKLAQKYGGLADVLQATKNMVVKAADTDIVYEPGTELTVKLTKELQIKNASEGNAASLQPFAYEDRLIDLVYRQPFQTFAANPPRPSDLTNMMFIGTLEQLENAFRKAGWSTAAELNSQSKLETARAIIEQRGYKEGPVSTLLLDGRPPDLVYQKQNNTFAQRHHLRIWRRPDSFNNVPVWVCAATHDIGIDFSQRDYTFIHRIDPRIDLERAKVVNDLLFTGKVKSLALVDRPQVPRDGENATGDKLETDARMAVLLLAP